MAETNWYAVRTVPGSQRMARVLEPANDETEEQKADRVRRKGESIVERNLRNEGIDVYMPSFWAITQHQRTNKMREKRFPLLIGYAFVNIHQRDFERVRGVEGVMCFMRPSPDRGPIVFRDTDIGGLMLADFEKQQVWEREREERLIKAQSYRRNALNKRLGLIFPKGKRKKMPLRILAEAAIDSLSPASRQHVLLILNELKAMDQEMEACRRSANHLYSAA
ncbi:transcription termination/antitermination NusG family protein [Neorhizobium sp. CSC1952]|uniref:transcription termination/antitermination NusG family protein n=1 Tax=Neorhizobium sp. CSC1952 TaxID=2978974 RepID=UPI0025A57C27|nr:transcription termination/antitermination NusG family protein [Rhizobium sp. CSC1952]WJR66971.1 transcription termination/antitermination NusG family protein [Rhizobium sp. CSC1952]